MDKFNRRSNGLSIRSRLRRSSTRSEFHAISIFRALAGRRTHHRYTPQVHMEEAISQRKHRPQLRASSQVRVKRQWIHRRRASYFIIFKPHQIILTGLRTVKTPPLKFLQRAQKKQRTQRALKIRIRQLRIVLSVSALPLALAANPMPRHRLLFSIKLRV